MDKPKGGAETRALWAFVVLVALMFILAGYGYFSGAWETPS